MKILLDECVPVRLHQYLPGFEISSVSKEKWTSFKNGKLINKSISADFELMITVDKNLQYQQNKKTMKSRLSCSTHFLTGYRILYP